MATELGQAYVQIMPSAKGISGSIQKTLDPEALAAGKSAGSSIASSMASSFGNVGSSLTKKITLPAAAAATAAGGIVAAFGWKRLTGLDSAQAQLKGLGYEVADVDRISKQVSNSVQGTVMTMAEGTSVAAGALAAGVAEGAELEGYIRRVGNAAVGSGRDVGDMAQIFNRVQGSGKLMTQELNMIEDGMPGFAMAMSESLGVTQAEFRKMVTAGEVSSEQFMSVMDSFAGEMSEAYAASWAGMVANTKSNIGIIGQSILGGVFEQSKDSIAEFLEYLRSDDVRAWATEVGAAIGSAFTTIIETVKGAIQWWSGLDGTTKKLILTIAGIAIAIGPVMAIISKLIGVVKTVSTVFAALKVAAGVVGVAVGAISAPVAIAIAAIAAIIAIGVLLYKNWDTIKAKAASLKASIAAKFEAIKTAISDKINAAKEAVRKAIEAIKKFFQFEWSLPKIKLPHFSIKGKFNLSPPSVPKLGVKWYDQGGIFDKPSIIGVGEKRPEFVGALDDLRYLIRGELDRTTGAGDGKIEHTGTITVRGVNNEGQLVAVVEATLGRNISEGGRRIPNRVKMIPI